MKTTTAISILMGSALLCLSGVSLGARSPASEGSPIVNPPAGSLQGVIEGGMRSFKGIPYAVPPVGNGRWKPPAELPRWSGVKKALQFGPACNQPPAPSNSVYANDLGATSEDCLTLNIWSTPGASHVPVFLWIHGGALQGGSSKEAMYDGARLAAHGVVVVTINYRLGVLGYLAHPELSSESPLGISGNYGLLDQIEALRWVKRNIAAFGGDPSNVTIAGESAGGLSVMYLLASPQARGLFAKAIAESAYMISAPELKQKRFGSPGAEEAGAKLAATLHASDLAALRAMDAQKLTEAAAAAYFAPSGVIDGHVLMRQLVQTFDHGEQNRVPLMAGFNSGEIRSLRMLAPPAPATAEEYERIIRERYEDLAPEFLRLYPSGTLQESVLATTRDALYGWTSEKLAMRQATLGQPSYLYLFDHGYPSADAAGLHAFHASELPFVFGTADKTPPNWPKIDDSAKEAALSETMMSYWSSFAKTGRPAAPNAPDWPIYGSSGAYLLFTDVPHAAEHLFPGMYALHDEAVCRRLDADLAWNWNVGVISPPLAKPKTPCR